MPKDQLSDGTLEEAIELAYWIYERRRVTQKNSESERDAFKCVVRKLINERNLVQLQNLTLTTGGTVVTIPSTPLLTSAGECTHMSILLDSLTGKSHCLHCKKELP